MCEHHSRVPNLVDFDMVQTVSLGLDKFHPRAGRHIDQLGFHNATQIDDRLNVLELWFSGLVAIKDT